MDFFKGFSFTKTIKRFGRTFGRFPVAVLLLAFLTVYLIVLIHNEGNSADYKWNFFYIFYPATGALLAVSLQLLTEDFKRRAVAVITQVVVHALWLGVSLYLTQFERFSMQQLLGVSATVVTMVLSLFLLCFFRKDDDVPFWNFAQRLLVALLSGLMVGVLLTLGIVLFVQSLDWLFGMQVDSWFPYIPTVCLVFLAPLLTMGQIPEGELKHIRVLEPYTGFVKGVVQYLFMPLLLLYMATLYVYAAKILFTWQLPVGWVCYLVSASMLGMAFIIFITYPLQHDQANSFFKRLTRWLPLAMIPLLVLMSVAIGRRLADYGITVSRLYVLVFNIWCYVVCIGLLITRNKRIWWVPASFAAVLFLISVGPWSIPNVTERRLLDEAHEAFAATGIKQLPLSGEQYQRWLESADKKVAASIDGKLAYLQRDYGYASTMGLIGKDAVVGLLARETSEAAHTDPHPVAYYNSNWSLMNHVAVPQGYAHMTYVDAVELQHQEGNRLEFDAHVDDAAATSSSLRFQATLNQFIERDLERNRNNSVEPLILDNGEAALVVDYFNVSLLNDSVSSLSVTGILFTK